MVLPWGGRCDHGDVRVLLVEDEDLIARATRESLEVAGYAVDHAARGDEGLWLGLENDYDVIILDVMLPGKNGFLICRELRAEGIDAPILMLTAKDGEFDQAEGLDTGADDYMTKPYSLTVLHARVRALVRRGPTSRKPVLSAGDLSLDPSERSCRRGDAVIDLTPREFDLLRYLMHRAGEPVSKQDLLDHVWADEHLDTNVVQVYAGYLRRKIDEPFGRRALETVRGFGYQLRADGG